MKAVDPRAGKLCSNCNRKKPLTHEAGLRMHCSSPTCDWWVCGGCKALNDSQGRNSETALDGTSKRGQA